LLAVVNHIEANGDLLLHDIGHRRTDPICKGGLVQGTTFLTQAEQLLEFPRARQAPCMRR
jgi:hypothetical protein